MGIVRVAALALMCLCLAGIARAEGDSKQDAEKQEHDAAKAVLAVAKIDLLKAIEIAQAKIPTGKPILVQTEQKKTTMVFEVLLLVGEKVTEVQVNAVTGAIAKVEEDEEGEVEDLPEAKKVLAASKITFAQAITIAKGKVDGGKPFEVDTEIEDGKPIIEVGLLAGDKIMNVEIDAVTGKVLEVEEDND